MAEIDKQYIFVTSSESSPYVELDGTVVTVLRPLTAQEADLEETGPMYRVRQSADPWEQPEFDAFEDELQPLTH